MEFEMSETNYKFDRDASFDDLESIVQNIESIPTMNPGLNRVGVSKPQKDQSNRVGSVVEIGFRNFHKGQLNFHDYDLYE